MFLDRGSDGNGLLRSQSIAPSHWKSRRTSPTRLPQSLRPSKREAYFVARKKFVKEPQAKIFYRCSKLGELPGNRKIPRQRAARQPVNSLSTENRDFRLSE